MKKELLSRTYIKGSMGYGIRRIELDTHRCQTLSRKITVKRALYCLIADYSGRGVVFRLQWWRSCFQVTVVEELFSGYSGREVVLRLQC